MNNVARSEYKNLAELRRVRQEATDIVPLGFLSLDQLSEVHEIEAEWGDPLEALDAKISHLAEILNCSEKEATRLFLSKL